MARKDDPLEEIERVFELMNQQFGTEKGTGSIDVDLLEEGERFVLRADLPGYQPEDVDVQVSESRTVRITGNRDVETASEEGSFITRERHHERHSRSVSLPEAVEEDAAQATYEAGVLTVTLPKRHGGEGGTDIPVN